MGSTREAPSEKNSLAEELALTEGRKAAPCIPALGRGRAHVALGLHHVRLGVFGQPDGVLQRHGPLLRLERRARRGRQQQDQRHAIHAIPR